MTLLFALPFFIMFESGGLITTSDRKSNDPGYTGCIFSRTGDLKSSTII